MEPRSAKLSSKGERAVLSLYSQPLTATRTGPLYNAFSYPTKISPEVIALFIATHTEPGATILDPFAGSGTAGIATKLCDRPTPIMMDMATRLGIAPKWGPRHAILYDIGVLGAFIARVMCSPPDPERFRSAAVTLVDAAEASHGWLYDAIDPEGNSGSIRHVVWSDVLVCPSCGVRTSYRDACLRYAPLRIESVFTCASCGSRNDVNACDRAVETVYDHLLGRDVERKVRIPAIVYGSTGRQKWQRPAEPGDSRNAERAWKEPVPDCAPLKEVAWGDLYRSGYHRGITHLHHFYTPRNYLALATLWDLVETFDDDLQDALRLLILSFNSTHSTLMTRVVVKKGQNDLVLTGAQSGVLYVSGLPVEKNIFKGVRRKIGTIADAFALVFDSRSTVDVVNASSMALDLPDASVQYVFTDPPFGDYIPYAEINQLNEAWLGTLTRQAGEIIISVAQGKDVESYGSMMAEVFRETYRVLDDTGRATVAFHSAKASVWRALTEAYGDAGFAPQTVSVLDKTQTSFKQVVSDTVVKGDPLILLTKGSSSDKTDSLLSIDDIIKSVLEDASQNAQPEESTRERLFSRFVARCLVANLPVTVGARDFYQLVGLDRGAT
ncbi:DNA methyltransferase [Ferrimicrobium sp.]|uniref:DNA methyltransferase n=1 Tax=Ferrimicrobium sp. TaxID=2926050 RepID=UPI00263252F2|nr:DNA methyltransferase [Ferrimicrobium sp.]